MKFRKKILLLSIVYLQVCTGYGQNAGIDSLKDLLKKHPQADTLQAVYQIELAYALNFVAPDTAILLASRSLRTARRLRSEKNIGRAYHALGYIYNRKGNEGKALDALLKAIPHLELAKDKRGLTVTYRDIAVVYEKQKQIAQALSFYQKSYKLANESHFGKESARQLAHIAVLYNQYYHKSDTATALLAQALKISAAYKDEIVTNFILENMGYAHLNNQEYTQALQVFNQILKNHQQTKYVYGMANAHKALSITYKRIKDEKTALRHALKAMELAQVVKDKDLVRGIAFSLANSYEYEGDYKKALYYQRMGEQAKDSIYNTEKTAILNDLQTKFAIQSQQRAIDLLNKNKRLQEQELRTKTYERNVSIAGLLLLAALAVLLYQYIGYQRQNNRLLQEKSLEIQHQKEQLVQLNATKDKLFSIISHDIRSPLNSLEATLELLEEGYLTAEEMQTIAPELRRKVHTTSGLLTNILHWAKSQMEGIVTNYESFPIQITTDELITTFQLPAKDKNISLECQVPASVKVHADRNMTSLILRNLVSNAIKFTPAGGTVTIHAQPEQDQVIISVKDTGKGMNDEQKSHLFDVKTHFSTSGTANETGTGLGLLLCKEFTEKNNGKIWVESQPDQGSCFFVALPAA